ncbi:hypothetical protein [Fluviicola taffensis]|uniref:Tetratricopeptide repeat protein n=1 Tax=Fluviicola taffensis (strain DSM 16823 / NCIMB 13979 / RW262) TaxID=755732 RepID=F2ICQ9_FLUTR|nr:hypothetical protein [Fluviicola taffensis]AEA42286.1 hypothetical protein Fluta_0277 [Fluviicola taffensis DSM 16823]
MKIRILPILGLACLFTHLSFSQNLKPEKAISLKIDIPPINLDYIGLTKIYVQPSSTDFANIRGLFLKRFNERVYTFESSIEASELYFTFQVNRIVKKNTVPSTSSSVKTDKKGNKTTTTTYRYDGEEQIDFTFTLNLANGTPVKMYQESGYSQYSGTSTLNYESARTEYGTNKSKKVASTIEEMVGRVYAKICADYFIGNRNIDLYAIGVKSRKQDYSDINNAGDLLTNWFATNPTDALAPDVVKALLIYDEALLEHEPKDKKARIDNEVAAVCYYQKACVEFYLKNYRKAEELILKSESLDKRIHFSQENLKDLLKLLRDRKVFN